MASDEKLIPKVGPNTSSSAVSSPDDKCLQTSNSPESLQDFPLSFPKNELVDSCFGKERKQIILTKCKTYELKSPVHSSFEKDRKQTIPSKCKAYPQKSIRSKGSKYLDLKSTSSSEPTFFSNHGSKKKSRKGDCLIGFPSFAENSQDGVPTKTLICRNSACRAILATEDTFCKRCSCCICHVFDDNKDPSLWLVCTSQPGYSDSCGLSCHIECALQNQKAGVVSLGHCMELDGSYCCCSCGKISGIIECWKKQLVIARDARRVDVLCHRISLSHRILDGTSRFKELHEIVGDAKDKLENEVGAVNGVSAKMARGIVSRLSVANDVQKLCNLAIEKADEWLTSIANAKPIHRENSLPHACRFQFESITSSSLVINLKEARPSISETIKGYKLWYCKSREDSQEMEPVVFTCPRKRILISNLQPCTEYTFRIISFTDKGDFGHSFSKCFTKSVEIIPKSLENCEAEGGTSSGKRKAKVSPSSSSGFKVRDLGRILRRAWAEEHGDLDGFCSDGLEEESCGGGGIGVMKPETAEEEQPRSMVSQELDLNMSSVPDLNAEIIPPAECFHEDVNGCTSEKRKRSARSSRSDLQTWAIDKPTSDVPLGESQSKLFRRKAVGLTENWNITGAIGSPLKFSNKSTGELDGHYEYCVRIIRWLECRGHIEKDFRMKFLTWFSLRSTEQERRVVHTFIDTLVDDPGSLAGQLVDSFLEITMYKKPINGFCSKLWH